MTVKPIDRVCGLCAQCEGRTCLVTGQAVSHHRKACGEWDEDVSVTAATAKVEATQGEMTMTYRQKLEMLARIYVRTGSLIEVTRTLNISELTARQMLRKAGIKIKPAAAKEEAESNMPQLTEEQKREIIAEFDETGSVNKAAQKACVDWKTAKAVLDEAGRETKPHPTHPSKRLAEADCRPPVDVEPPAVPTAPVEPAAAIVEAENDPSGPAITIMEEAQQELATAVKRHSEAMTQEALAMEEAQKALAALLDMQRIYKDGISPALVAGVMAHYRQRKNRIGKVA